MNQNSKKLKSIQINSCKTSMKIDLFEIFCMGVDYGQLLMEEERQSEGMFDAFLGKIYDNFRR